MKGQWAVVGLALSLASCGGGGGDGYSGGGPGPGGSFCFPIAGGASQLDTAPAPTASFENAAGMFDGNVGTFGTLETLLGTGSSTLTGTAQPGVVVPAGMIAGILLGASINNSLTLTITTYLDGVVQDSSPALTSTITDSYAFYGIQTTSPYDAIEATFTLIADASTIAIHELCFIEPFSF